MVARMSLLLMMYSVTKERVAVGKISRVFPLPFSEFWIFSSATTSSPSLHSASVFVYIFVWLSATLFHFWLSLAKKC